MDAVGAGRRAVIPLLVTLLLGGFHPLESQAAPGYAEIVLSDAKGGAAKNVFKPHTPKFFLNAKLVDVPGNSRLRSDWIMVNTAVAPPNYRIESHEIIAIPGAKAVEFNFQKALAEWPEGEYRVDLFIDGMIAGYVTVQVVK
jgi:hypothetical protein